MTVPDAFMEEAWAAFLQFAWGEPEFHAAYRKYSGDYRSPPASSPLDAAIDKACGVDKNDAAYMRRFIDWVTEHYWGADEAPAKWRKARGLQ